MSRNGRRHLTRQELVLSLLDMALRGDCVGREFGQGRAHMPAQERELFERWDRLANEYLAGIQQLRDEVAAQSWTEEHARQ